MYSRRHWSTGDCCQSCRSYQSSAIVPPTQVWFTLHFSPTCLLHWLPMSLPAKVESWIAFGCLGTLLKCTSSYILVLGLLAAPFVVVRLTSTL
ncbi:hypothetical protein BDR03DRAFT_91994 [Suillus americanus]|nr:hypothetical protein BDR03DRAFT_91994 [Suillus americanus]